MIAAGDPAQAGKSELRRAMRARRRSLEDRSARSERIWQHVRPIVAAVSTPGRPTRVLLFDTIPGEPETAAMIEWCRSAGLDTAVPDDVPLVAPTWPDVVIVPGLAFTRDGDRLGQGGGWYDRFLEGRRRECVTIGVGFDVQLVETLPVEPHDITLDHVVTESGRVGASSGSSGSAAPMAALTAEELAGATAIVRRHVPPTPQYEWPLLSEVAGSTVVVKHENHTPVGAFKVRGGLVYVDRLVRERSHVPGIVSATRGNHGQSLAFAGRAYGVAVCIVVPHGNSVEKNAAMRALGAEVIEIGADFQEAREASIEIAAARGFEPVPPFHRDLVLGVATYAIELFDGAGPLDTVYVPVGMGSGINALAAVRDLRGLPTAIVGVVSEVAPATQLSFEAGRAVTTPAASTFVDGVACRAPDEVAVAGMLAGAARIVTVSEDATAEAMRIIYRATHNVAEPAGAIGLAGLLSEPAEVRGARSAFVLSGGNVDTTQFVQVLSGTTPAP